MTPETEQQMLDDIAEIKGLLNGRGRINCQAMMTAEEVGRELMFTNTNPSGSVR